MYWIEICNDGSYVHEGVEYPLPVDNIEIMESQSVEGTDNEFVIPFEIETEHGVFAWEVDIIEYVEIEAASLLGSRITQYPGNVYLKDEVIFRMQDGWLSVRQPTLDMKPRMTKMRLG